MAKNKAETIIKNYKKLAQIPALISAKYAANGNILTSVWSQRNLEKGKSTRFIRTHYVNGELGSYSETSPIDISSESLSTISPSETYKAIIRDANGADTSSQFLEIWSKNNIIRSIDLSSLDLHGKVYTDGEFASLEWSPDENKILYVAEKKVEKSEPLHKRKKKREAKGDDEMLPKTEPWKSEQFRQDWGEQLVGKIQPVLVFYNIQQDDFTILKGIPDDVSVATPIWSPNGDYIVGCAYFIVPRKLGLIYCTNRPSTIFQLDLDGNFKTILREGKSVKSPRFTPNGKSLIWLERDASGPHNACMTLMQTDLPIIETVPLVKLPIVKKVTEIANDRLFSGLYNSSFPKRCWTKDGRLVFSTNQINTINSYVFNLDSGVLTELEFGNGSLIILDVFRDNLLGNQRNFFKQDALVSGNLPEAGRENEIAWKSITEAVKLETEVELSYQYLDLVAETVDDTKNFSAIYVGPKTGEDKKTPLILWPHGGPHSAFANNLALETSIFLSLKYAIIMVNYRGSIGAGESSINYLPGRCGTTDVADCVQATQTALKLFPWLDSNRIALVGGSHGGFLVTHLSGQHPELYKAVVARNPVIDIASMSTVSDIPDWCYVESGHPYTQVGPLSEKTLLDMRKASPIQHAHNVKAPTLLQIGTKDLRVPPSQGVEYYHRLKANNVIVEMNIYDDNHPLGSVPNEMNNIISTAMWLEEHLN